MTVGLLTIIADNSLAMDSQGGHLIRAERRWNDMGIDWVKGRRYRIRVEGHWKDAAISTDASGYRSDDEQVSILSRPFLKLTERWRRMPGANWFSLICTIDREQRYWFDMGAKVAATGSSRAEIIAPATGRFTKTITIKAMLSRPLGVQPLGTSAQA